MPMFRATDAEGNVTDYDEPTPRPEHFAAGWRLEEIVVAQAAPDAPVEPVDTRVYGGRRELTPLEFLRLLTSQERVAIRTAAKTNPYIEDYLDLVDKADSINLDNADVSGGLTILEAGGLLATGRAEEILNG